MESVFIIHLVSTLYMVGLCWFVQIVHYPLFQSIDPNQFTDCQKKNWVTGYVTGPIMIVELITGLILWYQFQDQMHYANMALIAITGFSTILVQIPIHLKLKKKYSAELILKLIRSNWMRTISWTCRGVLLAILLTEHLSFNN